jgi:hypothetical protein
MMPRAVSAAGGNAMQKSRIAISSPVGPAA